MKIGILTFHRATNCGAALQALSLKLFLERKGHEVGFVANSVGEAQRWFPVRAADTMSERIKSIARSMAMNFCSFRCLDLTIDRFRAFRKKCLPEVRVEDCDLLVIGSDQVWRRDLTGAESGLFLGESTPRGIPIIVYAASFGDGAFAEMNVKGVIRLAVQCHAVSVREQYAAECILKSTGREVAVVADPTLLLEPNDYSEFVAHTTLRKPYLFAYAVHATPFFVQTAKMMAKRLGLAIVMVAACQLSRWRAPSGLTYGVSPDRMLGYMQRAQCVVASSFHGTALALLYRKPFVCLCESRVCAKSRQKELLVRIGEESRVVMPQTSIGDIERALVVPPCAEAQKRLEQYREFSALWLDNAIRMVGN